MTLTIQPMSLRLEPTDRARLKQIAMRKKRTPHSLAAEAVRELIKKEEQEYAFNQSCLDSYNNFLETGLHVNQNEIDSWVDSLSTEKELPIPTCHR